MSDTCKKSCGQCPTSTPKADLAPVSIELEKNLAALASKLKESASTTSATTTTSSGTVDPDAKAAKTKDESGEAVHADPDSKATETTKEVGGLSSHIFVLLVVICYYSNSLVN